jgi:hypothetical protein
MTTKVSPELFLARQKADELGLSYHHNANAATVQKRIDDKLAEQETITEAVASEGPQILEETVVPMTAAEYKRKYNANIGKKISALMRVRIQNMNPSKKEWPGEIVSVGSAKRGTFKKYIPFNSSEPYHIPKIMYDMLMDKKCTIFSSVKDERGNTVRKGRLANEYAIEVLEPLTRDELSDLARTQSLQAGQQ